VWVLGLAVVEPGGVEGDHEDVVEELRCVLAVLEALEVEVEQGVGPSSCFVHRCDYHGPVLHGHFREQLSEARESDLHVVNRKSSHRSYAHIYITLMLPYKQCIMHACLICTTLKHERSLCYANLIMISGVSLRRSR
jgi:hypothetical protein